jgi:hypothetical protein
MRTIKDIITDPIWKDLSESEITQLVNVISIGTSEDLPTLISLLGKVLAGRNISPSHRKLIEKYLHYPDDPMVSAVSLKVLCREWGLTLNYLELIKKFIRGIGWDVSDEVRFHAINIAGEYLREAFDKELLQLLLFTYQLEEHTDTIRVTREDAHIFLQGCAYEALARASGKDWDEIPSVDDIEEYISQQQFTYLDNEVVEKARKLISG